MTYKSILVNVDIDRASGQLVRFATELAARFDAHLIGFSAADVPLPPMSADGMIFDGEVMREQTEEIERRVEKLKTDFHAIAGPGPKREWRGGLGNPTRLLVEAARAADLIVTQSPDGASAGNAHRCVDLGSLVLQTGRPVLMAAGGAERMASDKALIAWKDTREARRAVFDAIPLLARVKEVRVITVENDASDNSWNSAADVVSFLSRHGIKADSEVFQENSGPWTVAELAKMIEADLVVSGGYGHSRLREWVFGGVTRSLLEEQKLNRFMSN
jgi:nucleotide-binding universal stress UspA family protein